jgi:DNA-binding NtrC family response regulator
VKTIFVIDDDPDQAELLARALSRPDRDVRAFSDPIRALGALTQERAHLLVADLSMPWIDGAQMIATAREQAPDLAIVLVSGYARGASVAAEAGLRFFAKPINLAELGRTVDAMLAALAEPHPSGEAP